MSEKNGKGLKPADSFIAVTYPAENCYDKLVKTEKKNAANR